PSRSKAARLSVKLTCAYRFMVTSSVACPTISITVRGGTPSDKSTARWLPGTRAPARRSCTSASAPGCLPRVDDLDSRRREYRCPDEGNPKKRGDRNHEADDRHEHLRRRSDAGTRWAGRGPPGRLRARRMGAATV